jgi:hypothetical protein
MIAQVGYVQRQTCNCWGSYWRKWKREHY